VTRLALVALLLGCSPYPAQRAVPDDACEAAGARLAELGCPEARTPRGTPFAAVCRRAAADGRNLRADCLRSVQSCADVERVAATPEGAVCP
jgi:hypothetical protein